MKALEHHQMLPYIPTHCFLLRHQPKVAILVGFDFSMMGAIQMIVDSIVISIENTMENLTLRQGDVDINAASSLKLTHLIILDSFPFSIFYCC